MKNVSILGIGLMGGSLGLALKAREFDGTISAYARRVETRESALAQNVVDKIFDDPAEAVKDADVVVLCVPILSMKELLSRCKGNLKKGCVVTDVGSTKSDLDKVLRAELEGTDAHFIGSHPIAGSELQGIDAARASLYDGAVTVITPHEDDNEVAVKTLKMLWTRVGAIVKTMKPREHDVMMARTSHLPHIVAALVAVTAARDGDTDRVADFCGTGFRDTTRIAEGSPDVWHDIIRSNRESIKHEIENFQDQLAQFRQILHEDDYEALHSWLGDARTKRMALTDKFKGDPDGDEG